MKPPKMTRRQLAGAILTTAVVAAQTPSSPPPSPTAELQAAQEQNQHTAEALAKTQIPMDTEPAFHFKA